MDQTVQQPRVIHQANEITEYEHYLLLSSETKHPHQGPRATNAPTQHKS